MIGRGQGVNGPLVVKDVSAEWLLAGRSSGESQSSFAIWLATRRFKDWGEVVELIGRNQRSEEFASHLDPSMRSADKQRFNQANDPQYGEYSRP